MRGLHNLIHISTSPTQLMTFPISRVETNRRTTATTAAAGNNRHPIQGRTNLSLTWRTLAVPTTRPSFNPTLQGSWAITAGSRSLPGENPHNLKRSAAPYMMDFDHSQGGEKYKADSNCSVLSNIQRLALQSKVGLACHLT